MQQKASRSSLFLLELIIAIAFFSVASAFCVQFFVKSHQIEQQSYDLNHAVNAATSVAEQFRSTDMKPTVLYYNKDWVICDSNEAIYSLEMDIESSNSLLNAQITVKANNSILYELNVLKNANSEVIRQ